MRPQRYHIKPIREGECLDKELLAILLIKSDDGEWVRFSDHEARMDGQCRLLMSAIELREKTIESLESLLAEATARLDKDGCSIPAGPLADWIAARKKDA